MAGEHIGVATGMDRSTYMFHFYNAMFSDRAQGFPVELRARIVAEVGQDLCKLVRTLPPAAQDEFLRDIRHQVKPS